MAEHRCIRAVCRYAPSGLQSPGAGGIGGATVEAISQAGAPSCVARGIGGPFLDLSRHGAASRISHFTPRGWNHRDDIRSRTIARKPPSDPPAKPKRATTAGAASAAKPTRRRAPTPAPELAAAAKAPGTPRKKAAVAGPEKPAKAPAKRRAPAPKRLEPSELDRIQAIIVTSLDDDKGEEIVTIDLAGRTSFADRMIIATGMADRQIAAMAQHLDRKLHDAGVKRVRIEGAQGSDWVLIDAGDIVIHLFRREARALYALEKMWGKELDEPVAEITESAE